MNYTIYLQNLLRIDRKIWLFVVGLVAMTHMFCQSLMLPYGNALLPLLPGGKFAVPEEFSLKSKKCYAKAVTVSFPLSVNTSNVTTTEALLLRSVKRPGKNYELGSLANETARNGGTRKSSDAVSESRAIDGEVDFVEDVNLDNDMPFEEVVDADELGPPPGSGDKDVSLNLAKGSETRHNLSLEQVAKPTSNQILADKVPTAIVISENGTSVSSSNSPAFSPADTSASEILTSNLSTSAISSFDASANRNQIKELPKDWEHVLVQSDESSLSNNSAPSKKPARKKMRCEMPPKSVTLIHEMEQLLVRHRARSRAMRPRWSSQHDQEIFSAKLQIENAPILKNDEELYAPLYRNISTFKRSYQLMERILKVYIYKEGEKPIFHQPILKGLYASEGWFMKLMEGNKNFIVKEPRRANLFYMPFSSRMLEHTLYIRNSHNRTNLRQYLKDYSEKIAAKYRFWNRTGGADHFLVACHDWAPYETRHHMEHCIKALCNADVTMGFKIGRDVSLPETYVRSARDPLRDVGGKPPSQRHILAFYAGNMHGYLRPILLKHWKDKDPDMKIFGPMRPGVASKMNYIQHMKSSKYCICPKGYEVNSPRVVEAIFYECVPVIVSDNFVPPFFEILKWKTFSVIVAEKDIPNLKEILLSIPEEEYFKMQFGVRKVQQHFLWHAKPRKYDLFHMTLHSIWYNRIFQLKLR